MPSKPLPVDVTGRAVRGPFPHEPVRWSLGQLEIAAQIIDNPGGGLLFATQTLGQVRSTLQEDDEDRWAGVCETLERAEDHGVRREFDAARGLIGEARSALSSAG